MKVCFMYDAETNEDFLKILSKMTPGRSGKWKDMVGVTSIEEADWVVVVNRTSRTVPLDRTLFISAEPALEGLAGHEDHDNKIHKLDNKNTFGFGEWWIKHDYDTLSAMKCPDKQKDIVCIMSNSGGRYGRERRKDFAGILDKNGVHVCGRIKGIGTGELGTNTLTTYWFGKADVLEQYKYSVAVDIGQCKHYFSERFFDSMLMWCLPLYWGGTNVEDYLPKESFRYIDIYGDGSDVLKYTNSDEWEKSKNAIAEARDLILNKYQIWARVYDYVRSI